MESTAKSMVLGVDLLPKTVRLIPNLSIAALQHGLDKELAMWYCLRAINYWGSGCISTQYAVQSLTERFGYSKSTAYRIMNAGSGLFWSLLRRKNVNGLQIKIHSLKNIASYFDIDCGRYLLEIPIEQFVGRNGGRVLQQRAWSYASFHKPTGTEAKPISRASIQRATGVNRRSQQRYDKATVTLVANYADKQDTLVRLFPFLSSWTVNAGSGWYINASAIPTTVKLNVVQ